MIKFDYAEENWLLWGSFSNFKSKEPLLIQKGLYMYKA